METHCCGLFSLWEQGFVVLYKKRLKFKNNGSPPLINPGPAEILDLQSIKYYSFYHDLNIALYHNWFECLLRYSKKKNIFSQGWHFVMLSSTHLVLYFLTARFSDIGSYMILNLHRIWNKTRGHMRMFLKKIFFCNSLYIVYFAQLQKRKWLVW